MAAIAATTVALASAGGAVADDGADWMPLRGSSIKVGCTWSNGCPGGYHGTGGKAIDFIVPSGTPVFASGVGAIHQAKGGCAVRSDGCNGGRGNFLTIKHGSRYSRYLHLSKIVVSKGSVSAGQLIGYSGNSGQKAADHLHYDELTDPVRASGKLDPGTLYGCHGTTKKGYGRWSSRSAHASSVRNDGHELGCSTGAISIYALANDRYVSAEEAYSGGLKGMLRARAATVQGWERYQVVGDCRSGTGCAIRSLANGRYVSVEKGYSGADNGMVRARAGSIAGWERFKLTGDCTTGCALRAVANNRYVSAERGYSGSRNGMLRARATSVGGWEKFRFKPA